MTYGREFGDPQRVARLVELIRQRARHPARFMEFCGGHTHAILRLGLRELLPEGLELLSGPGCPVCVTAIGDVDGAIALARRKDTIVATFGDMIRVPGSEGSLQTAKADGADVRMVYSALDALSLARRNPQRQVVFLGIGFETTAPTTAAMLLESRSLGISNLSVLCLHKLTPPATRAILDAGEVQLSGIIGPGHVTTIIGSDAWEFLPREYGIPCAIAGFEPLDILQAVYHLVQMAEDHRPATYNAYPRSVTAKGNQVARRMMDAVFQVETAEWRGLGPVPDSGLSLRDEFHTMDAARRFGLSITTRKDPAGCRCGEVLRGRIAPTECPLFASQCTPDHPVGACMVSGEGACAAYVQYAGI